MTPDEASAFFVNILRQIAPETDFHSIDPDAELRDQIDIDSMDFLNAVMAIYEETGIDVPEEDYGKFETLRGAAQYLAASVPA
jgi:acyl carrier protein